MSIYVIADLHLSFNQNKPMNIFGENWYSHEEKIKKNWIEKVKSEDTVILPGDFSWATYLEDTKLDFKYLNELPGKKILLKGNHDYWWTTLKSMRNFLQENEFENIDFLYNNSYLVEDTILVGTRGWSLQETEESKKMLHRENERLKISLEHAINNYGTDKDIIVFMHYPPINSKNILDNTYLEFFKTMKKYNVKACYYGHLHSSSHKEAIEGNVEGIDFNLISADYLEFDLKKIK